jgi:hypothetical protein
MQNYVLISHSDQGLLETCYSIERQLSVLPSSTDNKALQHISKLMRMHNKRNKCGVREYATTEDLVMVKRITEKNDLESLKARRKLEAKRRATSTQYGGHSDSLWSSHLTLASLQAEEKQVDESIPTLNQDINEYDLNEDEDERRSCCLESIKLEGRYQYRKTEQFKKQNTQQIELESSNSSASFTENGEQAKNIIINKDENSYENEIDRQLIMR